MPLLLIVGVLLLYAGVRVGWLFLRRAIAARCRRLRPESVTPALRPWVERQAAWSFDDAWRKLWGDPESK